MSQQFLLLPLRPRRKPRASFHSKKSLGSVKQSRRLFALALLIVSLSTAAQAQQPQPQANSQPDSPLSSSQVTAMEPPPGPVAVATISAKRRGLQQEIAVAGEQMFFIGYDATYGHELWVSDGSKARTRMVKDIYVGDDPKNIRFLTPFGNRVLFLADDGTSRFGRELWISDGTEAGTLMVADMVKGPGGFRGNGFRRAQLNDTTMLFVSWHDVYRTDGTAAGTRHIFRIPGSDNQRVYQMHKTGGRVFLTNRYEIWVSDGTKSGTRELAQPGQLRGNVVLGDRLITAGPELWTSDGTESGTKQLADLFLGPKDSDPRFLQRAGDGIVFAATEGRFGYELYRSDGTEEGTRLLKDLTTGVDGTRLDEVSWWNKERHPRLAFFRQMKGRNDPTALWVSDGTAEGTLVIADQFRYPRMGSSGRMPYGFIVHEGQVHYFLSGRPHTLWRTDGTKKGTVRLPVSVPGYPSWVASRGGHLYAAVGTDLLQLL